MHKQKVFKKMGMFKNESYPVAENYLKMGLFAIGYWSKKYTNKIYL